ncbi:uncharacterized protein BO95DRAFT_509870 [Aspergillus brunneoviolaceus CBS 621.78]|uniref:Uncharacterized protein n=1 Tax=Aspergillus brunneoviolaceus CBS 621.78 TaxID=1450534 RepID=A0ACD1GQE1_9EURO|nr:hypothetical protein BO95DRAFT_509870 [Aspergillus brunneoviolaceus CBS 621.78]RAH51337.1 hypothetical protein BO95DRAFT_509870 [Aspergillus brunneoviolaceus CBS 621.78]
MQDSERRAPSHISTPQIPFNPSSSRESIISPARKRASHSPTPSRYLLQSSIPLAKRNGCARLQSCRDMRLGLDEIWSIQEGSLVLCINPSFTISDHVQPRWDELELVAGEILVVCRLYADLWALCASASFPSAAKSNETANAQPMSLAFVPLCAVTLVANFCAFNRRCIEHDLRDPSAPRFPGNGLPVMPPPRSCSLIDGMQLAQSDRLHNRLPEVVSDTLNKVLPECVEADYVPLDLHVGALLSNLNLSNLKVRRNRQSQCLGIPAAVDPQPQPTEPDPKPASSASHRFRKLLVLA